MRILLLVAALATAVAASAADDRVQLDPFARATDGDARCPEQPPPLLTADEARHEAHVRVERGTRCAMDGTCEPGGAYRRDPEVNEEARAAIAGDRRFANTSVWVTTMRKWVTLQGCVRSASQERALVELVKKQPNVERVFDELKVR
ncbi:MAG TPA: BON domain-containing protein [Casimicrobiaceae bacterium]|jgi:hypothetical protein